MAFYLDSNYHVETHSAPVLASTGTVFVRFSNVASPSDGLQHSFWIYRRDAFTLNFFGWSRTPAGLIEIGFYDSAEYRIMVPQSTYMNSNVWHNHLFTWDVAAPNQIYYIDNVSAGSSSAAFTAPTGLNYFLIGQDLSGGGAMAQGRFAEFAMWNRVLTAGERDTLQATGCPLSVPDGLMQYYPFNNPDVPGLNPTGIPLVPVGAGGSAYVHRHPATYYPASQNAFALTTNPGPPPGTLTPPVSIGAFSIFAPMVSIAGKLLPPLMTAPWAVYVPAVATSGAPLGQTTFPDSIDTAENLLIAVNNQVFQLSAALGSTSTSMQLAGDLSDLPARGVLTIDLNDNRTATSSEIIFYDGISGSNVTISHRGQDGTTAKSFQQGASVQLRQIALHHNALVDAIIATETEVVSKLDLAGGTMTGPLNLAGMPTENAHAANRGFVLSVLPTWYNARAYGLMGNGTTDDTAALQALLNTVAAAGGGRIFAPKGEYLIAGALQDTAGSNAQIIFPLRPDTQSQMTIDLVGEVPPATWAWEQPKPTGNGYTIFRSTLTGATGNASMFGGKQSPGSGLANNLMPNFKDLIVELPPNPTLTAIDCSNQTGNRFDHVLIHDGSVQEKHNQPTNSNSYGVKLPPTNHSSFIELDVLHVIGFYRGVKLGELTHGTIICQGCWIAVEVPFMHHPCKLSLVGTYGCAHGIYADTAGARPLRIDLLNVQDDTGYGNPWQNKVYDVLDAGNVIRGTFNWYNVKAGVGTEHTLLKNGGINFIGTELW